jgi:hypothetical protein
VECAYDTITIGKKVVQPKPGALQSTLNSAAEG